MATRRNTYTVTREDQRAALTSPIRLEIIGQFTTTEGMSIAEVAERMGRAPATLYYHFRLLESVGLLKRVGARKSGKRDEALYRPVARRIALQASRHATSRVTRPRGKRATADSGVGSGKNTRAGSDQQDSAVHDAVRTVSAAFRMAERDLETALTEGTARPDGVHRNFHAYRMHARINKKTLAELNKHLRAIDRLLDRESHRREIPQDADQYCSLTLALLPLRGRDGGSS